MHGPFPWKELLICFFPRCSREIGGRLTRLWQRVTIIGIISAVIEDGVKRVVYRGFFLNNPNFYKFCQHFPIQNISESANLRHTWFCQNSVHLLITSKTLFQNIFPNNNLKVSLQGELTKYLSASSDTKNLCLFVTLPPRQDRFQDNTYVFNN